MITTHTSARSSRSENDAYANFKTYLGLLAKEEPGIYADNYRCIMVFKDGKFQYNWSADFIDGQ